MTHRDIYEVANQLQGYVGPDTEDRLAAFLMREGGEAAKLADRIVMLEAALRMMPCPRPCNHRPEQFDAGDCFDAGECGCVAGNALPPTKQGDGE